jgi:hypothetical protein
MKKYFYFITTIRTKLDKNSVVFDSRTVGFFAKKEDASYCLEHDVGSLNEAGYYPWAVVEKIPEGLYPMPSQEDNEFWEWVGREDGHWQIMQATPDGMMDNNYREIINGEEIKFIQFASVG